MTHSSMTQNPVAHISGKIMIILISFPFLHSNAFHGWDVEQRQVWMSAAFQRVQPIQLEAPGGLMYYTDNGTRTHTRDTFCNFIVCCDYCHRFL